MELPIDERDIVFPYYGDALRDLTTEGADSLAAVRFPLREHEEDFRCAVVAECLEGAGITEGLVTSDTAADAGATEPNTDADTFDGVSDFVSGSLSNEWIQRGLSLLDRFVPLASSRSMAATAADVTRYLQDTEVQRHIETGVAKAFRHCGTEDTVVVGHSLGSIIAYRVLREGGPVDCPVTALITIGSPLGVRVIREALEPIAHPPKVGFWFNAYDERDIIALNPLNPTHFPVAPPVTNHNGVENNSENHHTIDGYLSDRVVVTSIVEALRGNL
jgi:pimeloyl-ACP methyl ester carboxylesterase